MLSLPVWPLASGLLLLTHSVWADPTLTDPVFRTDLDTRPSGSQGGYISSVDTFVVTIDATRADADMTDYQDSFLEFKVQDASNNLNDLQTPEYDSYVCNLTTCPPSDTSNMLCYCDSRVGDVFSLFLNVVANIVNSNRSMKAMWRKTGSFDPSVTTNFVTLPFVCAQASPPTVAVNYNGGRATLDLTSDFQTLTIPGELEAGSQLTFTVGTEAGETQITITGSAGAVTSLASNSVSVNVTSSDLEQNFTLSYQEDTISPGCGRSGSFTVLLTGGTGTTVSPQTGSSSDNDTEIVVGCFVTIFCITVLVLMCIFPRPKLDKEDETNEGGQIILTWNGPLLGRHCICWLTNDDKPEKENERKMRLFNWRKHQRQCNVDPSVLRDVELHYVVFFFFKGKIPLYPESEKDQEGKKGIAMENKRDADGDATRQPRLTPMNGCDTTTKPLKASQPASGQEKQTKDVKNEKKKKRKNKPKKNRADAENVEMDKVETETNGKHAAEIKTVNEVGGEGDSTTRPLPAPKLNPLRGPPRPMHLSPLVGWEGEKGVSTSVSGPHGIQTNYSTPPAKGRPTSIEYTSSPSTR